MSLVNTQSRILKQILDRTTLQTGYNMTSVRLGLIPGLSGITIQSGRQNVDNSGFIVNSANLPLNGLDATCPATVGLLGIASTDVNDTILGTGARSVLITGLDANYNPITETVDLDGQTRANTTIQFLRINQIQVIAAGSLNANQGIISLSRSTETFTAGGLPTTEVFITIEPLTNLSRSGIYTSRANCKLLTTHFLVSTDATTTKAGVIKTDIFFPAAGIPPIQPVVELFVNGSEIGFVLDGFESFPPKTDVFIRTKADSATVVKRMIVWFSFLEIDITVFPDAQ